MEELTTINGIGGAVASKLKEDYNITSIQELATADPETIEVPVGSADDLVRRAKQADQSATTASDMLDEYNNATFATCGVGMFDDAMGGGWEEASVALIYGKSGKGKTQLAFSTLVENSAEGTAVYIQTENQSKGIAERLRDLSPDEGDLDNIHIYEAYSIEDQYATYQKVAEEVEDPQVIVVDSFTAQFRMNEKFDGRESFGERSAAIGRHLNELGRIARLLEVPVVMTGQVYPTPQAYEKQDVPWGGEKMKHFISYFVRMSSGQGELNKATLENHPSQPEKEVLLNITGDTIEGVDTE